MTPGEAFLDSRSGCRDLPSGPGVAAPAVGAGVAREVEGAQEVRPGDEADQAVRRRGARPDRDPGRLSAINAPTFAADVTEWLRDRNALACYLTGFPSNREPDATPDVYGISAGDGDACLHDAGVEPPSEGGMISGPAGALLSHAQQQDLDAVGLVVETDPRFPDPLGARTLIEEGIAPMTGIDIDTDPLVEQAEEIMDAREQLAQRMQQAAQHESSQAEHTGMYQ